MPTGLRELAIITLAVLVACSPSSTTNEDTRGDYVSVDPQQKTDVDALRSLGYLGYSRDRAKKDQLGVVMLDESRSFPGYNLYTNRNLCSGDLVDRWGGLVRSWHSEPCHYWSNAELLPNGDLVVAGAEALDQVERKQSEVKSYVLRLTWEGDIVWQKRVYAHHDVDLTPRGQLLTVTGGRRRIPDIHPKVDVRDNWLTLLAMDGSVLQQLSFYDLFTSTPDLFHLQEVGISERHERRLIDLFHANSVEWVSQSHLIGTHPLYSASHVLVSVRHQDTVALIDWENEELVWVWGRGELSGPHDATLLENGHILLFDNGLGRGWSRVIELDPRTNEIVWQYQAPRPEDFFTASRGASQRLGNGNTLITNSDSGQVFEVTPEGEIVWEFLNTHLDEEGYRATIVRMKRYDVAFIEKFLE